MILDELERLGLTDNTLIILTSDNGPVVDDGYKDRQLNFLGITNLPEFTAEVNPVPLKQVPRSRLLFPGQEKLNPAPHPLW